MTHRVSRGRQGRGSGYAPPTIKNEENSPSSTASSVPQARSLNSRHAKPLLSPSATHTGRGRWGNDFGYASTPPIIKSEETPSSPESSVPQAHTRGKEWKELFSGGCGTTSSARRGRRGHDSGYTSAPPIIKEENDSEAKESPPPPLPQPQTQARPRTHESTAHTALTLFAVQQRCVRAP